MRAIEDSDRIANASQDVSDALTDSFLTLLPALASKYNLDQQQTLQAVALGMTTTTASALTATLGLAQTEGVARELRSELFSVIGEWAERQKKDV